MTTTPGHSPHCDCPMCEFDREYTKHMYGERFPDAPRSKFWGWVIDILVGIVLGALFALVVYSIGAK